MPTNMYTRAHAYVICACIRNTYDMCAARNTTYVKLYMNRGEARDNFLVQRQVRYYTARTLCVCMCVQVCVFRCVRVEKHLYKYINVYRCHGN